MRHLFDRGLVHAPHPTGLLGILSSGDGFFPIIDIAAQGCYTIIDGDRDVFAIHERAPEELRLNVRLDLRVAT